MGEKGSFAHLKIQFLIQQQMLSLLWMGLRAGRRGNGGDRAEGGDYIGLWQRCNKELLYLALALASVLSFPSGPTRW